MAVARLGVRCLQSKQTSLEHKYDPITQADYFALFAYFNTRRDAGLDGNGGVNPLPYLQAKTMLKTGEESGLKKTHSPGESAMG